MTKVDLITGFLGSGKTTFLKEYVNHLLKAGERICILEFDYGAVNVDMMLLQQFNDKCDLEMVAGGCDYDCHLRRFKTKLISMGMKKYDRVIIEPSGIFDIDEFFDAINEDPICDWYDIGSVISIVDSNLPNNLSNDAEYILKSQISSSGIVVISKMENKTEKDISDLRNRLNLEEGIVIAKPYDEYDDSDYLRIANASYKSACFEKRNVIDDNHFNSIYFLNLGLSKMSLEQIAKSLFTNKNYGEVIRIKGFIREDSSWNEFNMTANETNFAPIQDGQDVIIVIGESLNESEIKLLFDAPRK
ncbi:MAG: GTPase (G3E family) [Bacilli bacterium]|nr:GTPase (G3E family) [Bacilli bacterium]